MHSDRDLGMHAQITRRDFIDGVSATLALGSLAGPLAVSAQGASGLQVSAESPAYPPSLRGLRGQNQAALEVAHALRDGKSFQASEDTGEVYDLVVVGAGLSGLSAAYFYKKFFGHCKILVLDNCDDFGGHARRNEMHVNGKQIIAHGGTVDITNFDAFSAAGRQMLTDIGVDPDRYAVEAAKDGSQYAKMGMANAVYFDKETFGEDKLVRSNPLGFPGFASAVDSAPLSDFLKDAPLSASVKESLLRRDQSTTTYFSGLSRDEQIARLKKMSYQSYLLDVMKLDPKILDLLYKLDCGGVAGAAGMDSFSALTAYRQWMPGFTGMDFGPRVPDDWTGDKVPKFIHLPDGNGGVARLIVRWLIPGALPGKTMDDSIVPAVDYSKLDLSSNEVRIRLSSTVVKVHHNGSVDSAKDASVVYVKDGKAVRVTTAAVVMGCFNAIVPYLCPEIAEEQKKALHLMVRMPNVATNVVLRNWKAHEKLKVSNIYYPSGFHSLISLDSGVSMGKYRRSPTPDDPTFVIMMAGALTTPNSGLNARDQYRTARARLLAMPFEDLERQAREQLTRSLAGGGFDPGRDIAGIFVNRWGHGYAGCANELYDPEWTREQVPWVVGRKRFGLIAIANSDAGATCLTQAAVDQGNRAVTELISDVVNPNYGGRWGGRP